MLHTLSIIEHTHAQTNVNLQSASPSNTHPYVRVLPVCLLDYVCTICTYSRSQKTFPKTFTAQPLNGVPTEKRENGVYRSCVHCLSICPFCMGTVHAVYCVAYVCSVAEARTMHIHRRSVGGDARDRDQRSSCILRAPPELLFPKEPERDCIVLCLWIHPCTTSFSLRPIMIPRTMRHVIRSQLDTLSNHKCYYSVLPFIIAICMH